MFNIVQHCSTLYSSCLYTILLISIVLTMQITTKLNARKMAITIIALAAILATAPLLLSLQIANAANTASVVGFGSGGTVTCPSGPVTVTSWEFSGFKQRGSIQGGGDIQTNQGAKGVHFVSGTLASSHFTLTGTETFDSVCGLPPSTTVTFTGECGAGTVQVKAGSGESATLTGNVACSKDAP
jgi:hypothetical protein